MFAPLKSNSRLALTLTPTPHPHPHRAQATVGELCAHACAYATLLAQLAQVPPRKRRSFDWDRGAENEESRRAWDWGRVVRGPRHAC